MLKERIKNIKNLLKEHNEDEAINEMMELAIEYGLEELLDNIIPTEEIDYILESRLKNSGWQGVACLLAKVNCLNDNYYLINGYGNLEEISIDHLEMILEELEDELEEKFEEE